MSIFNRVVDDLLRESFFSGFKFRKRGSLIYKKEENRVILIEFQPRSYFISIVLSPVYCVHFDVLTKWFEKFSCIPVKTLRESASYGISGYNIDTKHVWFDFPLDIDEATYQEVYSEFRDSVIRCASSIFDKYKTLKDYFDALILPIIEGKTKLSLSGSIWIFKYLTACWIVAPDKYPIFKGMMLDHIKLMLSNNEPNIIKYKDRLDEIFDTLESTKF